MRYLFEFLRICGLVLIAFVGCLGGGDEEGCELDKCEGVVCSPDDNECTSEGCNPNTGSCASWPVEDGASCTYNGSSGACVNGVCGENLCEDVVCDDSLACTVDTCDFRDGTCDFTNQCNDYDDCTEDFCNPLNGLCDFTAPVEDGTSCEVFEQFHGIGACEAGVCVDPCDPTSEEELQCPVEGFDFLVCCPGLEFCLLDCEGGWL